MIRIYSYYNHGGFKDMYLGTFDEEVDVKYFIPLYKVTTVPLKWTNRSLN